MSIDKKLEERSGNVCELCSSTSSDLIVLTVEPGKPKNTDENIVVCATCSSQIQSPESMNPNHWRCLNDSMWSEVPAVKVMAWRLLNRIKSQGWPQDLLDMLYLDDEQLEWAKSSGAGMADEDKLIHLDSNGSVLQNGDTVILIKDLDVKGANFTAKRGTAVRNIRLVHDNPEHIEGKINGQGIVILTQYVKK